jgi:hypothetical protein
LNVKQSTPKDRSSVRQSHNAVFIASSALNQAMIDQAEDKLKQVQGRQNVSIRFGPVNHPEPSSQVIKGYSSIPSHNVPTNSSQTMTASFSQSRNYNTIAQGSHGQNIPKKDAQMKMNYLSLNPLNLLNHPEHKMSANTTNQSSTQNLRNLG